MNVESYWKLMYRCYLDHISSQSHLEYTKFAIQSDNNALKCILNLRGATGNPFQSHDRLSEMKLNFIHRTGTFHQAAKELLKQSTTEEGCISNERRSSSWAGHLRNNVHWNIGTKPSKSLTTIMKMDRVSSLPDYPPYFLWRPLKQKQYDSTHAYRAVSQLDETRFLRKVADTVGIPGLCYWYKRHGY